MERDKPIKGYVFHTTSPAAALKILADGCLKPLWATGEISFSKNPFFGSTVYPGGVTFVFPEKVIREKYGGYDTIWGKGYEQEEEVAVKGKLVYMSDCTEVLMERDVARKYGFGWKYPYKDVRYRLATPWRAFREFMPIPPWQGPPIPKILK